MDAIINDSELLRIEPQQTLDSMDVDTDILLKIYSDDYDLSPTEILKSIQHLRQLNSGKLTDVLLLARYRNIPIPKDISIELHDDDVMVSILTYGCVDLFKYLLDKESYEIRMKNLSFNHIETHLYTASYHGHLELVKLFINRMKTHVIETVYTRSVHIMTDYEVIVLININYYDIIQKAFLYAGQNAHLETMKYLYEMDDRSKDYYIHDKATEYYSLSVPLQQVGNNLYDCAFRLSNAETMSWLYDNKIDMRDIRQGIPLYMNEKVFIGELAFYDKALNCFDMDNIDTYNTACELVYMKEYERYDHLLKQECFKRVDSKICWSGELFCLLLLGDQVERAMNHYRKYDLQMSVDDCVSCLYDIISAGAINGSTELVKIIKNMTDMTIVLDKNKFLFQTEEVENKMMEWIYKEPFIDIKEPLDETPVRQNILSDVLQVLRKCGK